MNKEEALKILEVPADAPRRVVDEAYHRLTRKYQSRAQHGLDPNDREVAINAIGLVNEAYQAITGHARPVPAKPNHNTKIGRDNETPRVSLRQTLQPQRQKPSSPPPFHFVKSLSERFEKLKGKVDRFIAGIPRWPPKSPETVTAVIICVGFFAAAVVIVVCVRAQP